jgi:hypothetical protein
MTQATLRGSGTGKSTSNAALVIGWGTPVEGREKRVPQVLGEALSYFKRLEEEGQIESAEPIALEPHGHQMNGFVLLRGDKEQLARIRSSTDMTRLCNRAQIVLHDLDVIAGFSGQAFQESLNAWQQTAGDLT